MDKYRVTEPHLVPEIEEGLQIVDFSCGENNLIVKTVRNSSQEAASSQNNIAETLSNDYQFYSCGLNTSGQCGQPILA